MELKCRLQLCLVFLVVFLLFDISSVNSERSKQRSRKERSRHKNKQCEVIQTDFCNDVISYNTTRLPNAFGHRKLRHAERFLEEMAMVVETGCSPYLRALLCSMYLPECPHRKKNEPLPPCRPLCEKAKVDCISVYNSFGKEWPLETCDDLPEPRREGSSKRDRCINYEPPKPDFCMFHKDVGPCKTYYPYWYYDDVAKGCIPFTYGGCLGNKNRFSTKEACVRTCGNGKKDTSTTPAYEADTTTLEPSPTKTGSSPEEIAPPELVEPPRDAVVEAGGSVTLICSASRAIEYTWSRVDGNMPESKGRTINDVLPPNKILEEKTMSGRAKLVLRDLDPEDSGMYMCIAENDGGVVEGVADIHVQASPPVITQFPIAISVVEGGTFVMICAAEGAPSPEVEWIRFDNTLVQQTVNGSMATAEIRNAQMTDEGDYQCRATNKYGDLVIKSISIQVLVPVYLAEKPQSAIVTAGSNAVNLTCTAMGDPLPTITWVKLDGAREVDERRYEFDIMEEIGQIGRVTSTLRIYDVRASDAGTYECVAKSSLGNQTATATITVQVPPSFQKAPMDRYASIGEDVTLQCNAIGTPPLHIFWWKEGAGNLSLPDATFPRYSLDNEGMDLNIISVIQEDEGRYHCGIVNAADSIVGSMALRVSSQEDLPRIVKGPDNVTAHIGDSAVFTCNVTGNPLPDVRWFLDEIDIELFGESRYAREGTSLVVNDVTARDAGEYRCVAASVLGMKFSPTAELTVIVPTLAPLPPETTTPPPPSPETEETENNNLVEAPPVPLTTKPLAETTSLPPTTEESTKITVTGSGEGEGSSTCRPCEEEPVACTGKPAVLPRRYDITDIGKDGYFRGWVDVRGQGAANDFCRIIEPEEGRMQLVCALSGTEGESEYNYVSMLGFDQGMPNTWYMKDEDADGRDDYCRCVEIEENKFVWCMKAGEDGFDGHIQGGYMDQFTFKAPGDRKEMRKCRKRRVDPFFGLPVIPPS